MNIYPVIMCGGIGSRLWPTSKASSPKQFVDLLGKKSLFQETALRVSQIEGFARLIVVTGTLHSSSVVSQLFDLNIEADLILEPEGRDSAPAIAAASLFIADRYKDAIAVIVASDHHIPSTEHFCRDICAAAKVAAKGGIVTLGIQPNAASSAYGYIEPANGTENIVAVQNFVEKPDTKTAQTYMEKGYLWNSGNFIASASTLVNEFKSLAPSLFNSVFQGIAEGASVEHGFLLGNSFRGAEKISMDYAIMEKTHKAMVLKSSLEWSDLGAWDAVYNVMKKDEDNNAIIGNGLVFNSTNCHVRVKPGRLAVVSQVNGLNVIVEDDVVFVTRLDCSQKIKQTVELLKSSKHPELNDAPQGFEFKQNAEHLTAWLDTAALPLWWSLGFNRNDLIWREGLTHKGNPANDDCRARVQGRQAFVFASAGQYGWEGPWREAVSASIRSIEEHYLRDDGLLRTLVSAQGNSLDNSAYMYDQTFVLLALAATQKHIRDEYIIECTLLQPENNNDETKAAARPNDLSANKSKVAFSTPSNLLRTSENLLDRIETSFSRKNIDGKRGFRETGSHAYQSNAHMHLLEAALLWSEVCDEQGFDGRRWKELCIEITSLAIDCFIDSDNGFIREFFDENWMPASGTDGQIVEPGHQFEWAWLFVRWFRHCGDETYLTAAKGLFSAGVKGIDPVTNAAVDTMNDSLEPATRRARLWQQTEWLKASLVLHEEADNENREYYFGHIIRSHETLLRYLNTGTLGLWYDKLHPEEGFVHEISPASSLYHISSAIRQLQVSSESYSAISPS